MDINIYASSKSFFGRSYHLIIYDDLMDITNGNKKTKLFKLFHSFIKSKYILRVIRGDYADSIYSRISKDMCIDVQGEGISLLLISGQCQASFCIESSTIDAYGKNITFLTEAEAERFVNFAIEAELDIELMDGCKLGFYIDNNSNPSFLFHLYDNMNVFIKYENRN